MAYMHNGFYEDDLIYDEDHGLYDDYDHALCVCHRCNSYGPPCFVLYPEDLCLDACCPCWFDNQLIYVDAANWFYLNLIFHPEDWRDHSTLAARKAGNNVKPHEMTVEAVMAEHQQTVRARIEMSLRQLGFKGKVESMQLPPMSPGMPPGVTMKQEQVLAYKVTVTERAHGGADHQVCGLDYTFCCSHHDSAESMMGEHARRLARTAPPVVAMQLRNNDRMIVKVDGADPHGEHGMLLGYGWPRQVCDHLGMQYGFAANDYHNHYPPHHPGARVLTTQQEARPLPSFAEVDTNKDGVISVEEYESFRERDASQAGQHLSQGADPYDSQRAQNLPQNEATIAQDATFSSRISDTWNRLTQSTRTEEKEVALAKKAEQRKGVTFAEASSGNVS